MTGGNDLMTPQAKVIWDALEFRTPAMLRVIEPLSDQQIRWLPLNGVNSIGWLLWHIAEVEDNWIRATLLEIEKRYPFGVSAKDTSRSSCPPKSTLLGYFHEVRSMTKLRLDAMTDERFEDTVLDETHGALTGPSFQCWLT